MELQGVGLARQCCTFEGKLYMPELPEVETVVRSLRPLVTGRQITGVEFCGAASNGTSRKRLARILRIPAEGFRRHVTGARIERVERHGKNIVFHLKRHSGAPEEDFLLVHLGMTGRLTCEVTPAFRNLHTHLVFGLKERSKEDRSGHPSAIGDEPVCWLHYSDIRRFGRIRIADRVGDDFDRLGPDPLEISEEEFVHRLRSRRAMLKSLLLDQRFLRGLGNIYADESLFRAGIHPAAIAARLSRKRALRLLDGIRETLRLAIEQGGSSISDYVDATGQPGFFQLLHQVYQRTGEPCLRCGPRFEANAPRIRKIIIASRSTHYCPRCQTKAGSVSKAFAKA